MGIAATARLLQAEGRAEEALTLLGEAERLYVSDFFPNVRPVAALRARMWIAVGRLREARRWALEAGLSPEDELSYLSEFEHITLARLLLAAAKADGRTQEPRAGAVGLLRRLRAAADAGTRTGRVIEILILEALAAGDGGDRASALVALKQALTAAEPEGCVRLFVDEGHAMKALLVEASRRGYLSPLKVHRRREWADAEMTVRGRSRRRINASGAAVERRHRSTENSCCRLLGNGHTVVVVKRVV